MTVVGYVSRAVTVLFHPLLMPCYCALLTLYGHTPFAHLAGPIAARVTLNLCLYACLVPLATLGCFMLWGRVGSLEMPTRRERVAPLLVMGGLLGCSLLVVTTLNTPRPLVGMMASEAAGLLVLGVLALRWKVSMHGFGAGALLAFTVIQGAAYGGDFVWSTAFAFVVAGLSAWARLREGAHTPAEMLAGYLIGLLIAAPIMLLTMMHVML